MITDYERWFLEQVKIFKHIGYGRMLQIISSQWYAEQGDSAHVANSAFAYLPEEDRKAFLSIMEREKKEGMEYGL